MVPALIIVGMLLLAVLITCMLSKKRKAGKLGMHWKETLLPCIPVSRQKYAVVQEQVGESKNIKELSSGQENPSRLWKSMFLVDIVLPHSDLDIDNW